VTEPKTCDECSEIMVDYNRTTIELCPPHASAEARIARLEEALRGVLNTGLNGGNNIRLAYIAAGRKALTEELLAQAEA